MWVKRTQILAAKNGRLFEFLMCCHPSSFKREGNSLRLQSNRSISVKRGYYGYLDFSTGETGDGIDLLVRHLGYTFQDAVTALSGFVTGTSKPGSVGKSGQQTLQLPECSPHTSAVEQYLCRRGIPQGVIRNLLERKLLYQDAEHSNAVFLSRRKDFAEIRGTIQGKVYHSVRKKSSDLFWGYHPDPETRCTKAFVCEGAIDALSLYVLHILNQQADPGYVYCSIAGVANQKTIDRIASYLPIVLAVDNDEAGQKCRERNPGVEAVIPSKKDWNEDLLALLALDD